MVRLQKRVTPQSGTLPASADHSLATLRKTWSEYQTGRSIPQLIFHFLCCLQRAARYSTDHLRYVASQIRMYDIGYDEYNSNHDDDKMYMLIIKIKNTIITISAFASRSTCVNASSCLVQNTESAHLTKGEIQIFQPNTEFLYFALSESRESKGSRMSTKTFSISLLD